MKVYYQALGDTPSMAGVTRLKYKDVDKPSRRGDVITLPKDGWGLYQLATDFKIFLALREQPDEHDFRCTPPRQAWFGGTDEGPFLVELTQTVSLDGLDDENDVEDWLKVWQRGVVLEALKPQIIREFERCYGRDGTKRQGDMFCYPMPIQDWDKLLCVLNAAGTGDDWSWGPQDDFTSGRSKLYGTRHTFKGELAAYATRGCVVCKGLIQAPDHTDLVLEDIHVVAQTANLANPKKAD